MKDDQRAEIADLREKCDKLAGAVIESAVHFDTADGGYNCKHCYAFSPFDEQIQHAPDCPVQIAREIHNDK